MSTSQAMKIPVVISVLLLAAAAGLGWHDHQQLASLRAVHQQLVAQANARGVVLDPAHPGEREHVTKRPRDARDAGSNGTAADFMIYAREMSVLGGKPGSRDEATQKRMEDQMTRMTNRMMALDGSQLKAVIAELNVATDIYDFTRARLIYSSITRLAKDHPQQALTILTDQPGLLDLIHRASDGLAENLIQDLLAGWASNDPLKAIEWSRENGGKIPGYLANNVAWGLISGSMSRDPKLAFQLVGEMGLDAGVFVPGIARNTARTPEQRNATFAALREWCAAAPGEKTRQQAAGEALKLLALGESYQPESIDLATRWIDGTRFSPQELESFTQNLERWVQTDESGKWVEWLGKNLPTDTARDRIWHLFTEWSDDDYVAAGQWLTTAPDSPAKHAAALAYSETVFPKDPATAIQWALSVPAGEDRDRTLKRIHDNWPDNDRAAKEAFAKEHGIK